jgi:hypothetical protein
MPEEVHRQEQSGVQEEFRNETIKNIPKSDADCRRRLRNTEQ